MKRLLFAGDDARARSRLDSFERRSLSPVWLFPLTYVVHLLEEYFARGGFPAWAQRALGIHLTDREFVAWNAFALAIMCVGALLVSRHSRFRFIEIALAIAVLGNVAAHVIGSVATWTYSPGLVTGVFIWIPVGWFRLHTVARSSSRRTLIAGTCVGLFVTIVIFAVLIWTAEGGIRPRDSRLYQQFRPVSIAKIARTLSRGKTKEVDCCLRFRESIHQDDPTLR